MYFFVSSEKGMAVEEHHLFQPQHHRFHPVEMVMAHLQVHPEAAVVRQAAVARLLQAQEEILLHKLST